MQVESATKLLFPEVIGFCIALLGCALFSFLETSITALRLFKLKELEKSKPQYKSILTVLENNPHQVLITILIANSIVNVTAAALITDITERIFSALQLSGSLGFSFGIGIATCAILFFGEVIPKNIAKVHGDKLFRSTLWITNISYFILYPFVHLLMKFSNFFISIVGGTSTSSELVTSEREIRFLITYINQKGLMESEKTAMLQNIFKLGSKPVKEIMIPEIDIIMIENTATTTEALRLFRKYQFSRLPIYQKNKDNVVGMIYQKDVFLILPDQEKKPLNQLIRPILFVPESMKVNQLLREFRNKRIHIAMVTNEFGSITGFVTLEDVLEEIVGEIRDEYEEVTEKIVPLEKGGWIVEARIDLEALANTLPITFKSTDAVTLGGFLIEKLQRFPKKGERLTYNGYIFQVQKSTHKRVMQVLIFSDTNLL